MAAQLAPRVYVEGIRGVDDFLELLVPVGTTFTIQSTRPATWRPMIGAELALAVGRRIARGVLLDFDADVIA